MQFELTEALINDLLFSMEDRNGEFVLDTLKGIVVNADNADDDEFEEDAEDDDDKDEGRYIDIPQWESADGYRLMEKFAVSFKNTLIRKKLTGALDRGRGVFRAFKDALDVYPEALQLWYAFKEREMRRAVMDWYNALREEWGLARLGNEPEETGDLVLEDFRFRPSEGRDAAAIEDLRRSCIAELAAGEDATGRSFADGWAGRLGSEEPLIVAENGAGEFAGYAAAVKRGDAVYITALAVKTEYRGLGLGEMILTRLLETPPVKDAARVALDLPQTASDFSRALLRKSFAPFAVSYVLKPGEK